MLFVKKIKYKGHFFKKYLWKKMENNKNRHIKQVKRHFLLVNWIYLPDFINKTYRLRYFFDKNHKKMLYNN